MIQRDVVQSYEMIVAGRRHEGASEVGARMLTKEAMEPRTPTGMVRLPGRGGAALVLRGRRAIAGWRDIESTGLVLDIGIVHPWRSTLYLARPCDPTTPAALYDFLMQVARSEPPEQSLPTFQDDRLGLAVTVVQSHDLELELDVVVVRDLDGDVLEHDDVNFQTSRAAVVAAAAQAQELCEVDRPLPPGAIA